MQWLHILLEWIFPSYFIYEKQILKIVSDKIRITLCIMYTKYFLMGFPLAIEPIEFLVLAKSDSSV